MTHLLLSDRRRKKTYLPKFNSGAWTGTMNLTEPQSGTDLATIKTKAEHDGENWRIKDKKYTSLMVNMICQKI